MKFLSKRNWIITFTSIVLACLMVLSGVQIGRTLEQKGSLTIGQGFPTIRIGMAGVAAAGTADYTCTGTNDDVIVQAALNSLPANGGKLTFLSGNYSFSSTVTRLIPNVTIEGNGASTRFTFDGSTPIFTAGGNSWSFQDFVTDAGGVSMGATINWSWVNLNGQTYISTLNATQVNGTAGNFSTLNAPTGIANIVVATPDASTNLKAHADYVLHSGNETAELTYYMTLMPLSGNPSVNTTTGKFKVVGYNLNLPQEWVIRPTQAAVIDLWDISYLTGSGIRIDSYMNDEFYFPQLNGVSNGAFLNLNPQTVGPDNGIYANSSTIYIRALAGATGIGISANTSSPTLISGTKIVIDEVGPGIIPFSANASTLAANSVEFRTTSSAIIRSGGNITPSANNTFVSGNSTNLWANIWSVISNIGQLIATTANISTLNAGSITSNGSITIANNQPLQYKSNAGVAQNILNVNTNNDTFLFAGGGDLYILNSMAKQVFFWQSGAGTGRTMFLEGSNAASGTTTQSSPTLQMTAHYWDGSNKQFPFTIINSMTNNATASSNVTFSTNGTPWLIGENIGNSVGIYISVNGTIKKVYTGAADSGGVGYKMLIVPN